MLSLSQTTCVLEESIKKYDYRYEALKVLTRARHQTVQSLTREKQRFLNQLFMKFSGFSQEKIFSNNFGATATAVIENF